MSGVSATFFSKNSPQEVSIPPRGTKSPEIWANNLMESQKEEYNDKTLQKYISFLEDGVKEIQKKELFKSRDIQISFLEEPLGFVLDLFKGALNKIYQSWNRFWYSYELNFCTKAVEQLNFLKTEYTAITKDYSNFYSPTDDSSLPNQSQVFSVLRYQNYCETMAEYLKEPVQKLSEPQLDCLKEIVLINTFLKEEDLFFLLHKVLLVGLQGYSCQKENCFVLHYSNNAKAKIVKMGSQDQELDCFNTYFCRDRVVTLQITENGIENIKGLSSERIETQRHWIRSSTEKVISKPNFIAVKNDGFEYEIAEEEQVQNKRGKVSNLKAYLRYWKL
jgi:hypothetical protein